MNTTMNNNKNIQYRQVGDFNIPNLILPPEEANITRGKWGMLHKDYLFNHKKVLFTTLLRSVYKELHADRETGC